MVVSCLTVTLFVAPVCSVGLRRGRSCPAQGCNNTKGRGSIALWCCDNMSIWSDSFDKYRTVHLWASSCRQLPQLFSLCFAGAIGQTLAFWERQFVWPSSGLNLECALACICGAQCLGFGFSLPPPAVVRRHMQKDRPLVSPSYRSASRRLALHGLFGFFRRGATSHVPKGDGRGERSAG